MKKLILLSSLLFLAAACTRTNVLQPKPNSGLQIYRYSPYAFEFQYPENFSFTAPNYANLEDKIVQLEVDQSVYPGTNFSDAAFSVSAQFATNQQQCLNFRVEEQNSGFKNTEQINGITFYVTEATGVGAGNIYESRAYRTLHSSTCIELLETLHTGNIGNYPAGTVIEVDHGAAFDRLDAIRKTFRFY